VLLKALEGTLVGLAPRWQGDKTLALDNITPGIATKSAGCAAHQRTQT
jgi:hypothetical protein